jgi:hypothetical protein
MKSPEKLPNFPGGEGAGSEEGSYMSFTPVATAPVLSHPIQIGTELWYWRVARPGELPDELPLCRERQILLPRDSAACLAAAVTALSSMHVKARRDSSARVSAAAAEPLAVPALPLWPSGSGMPAVSLRARRSRAR